MCLVVVLLTLSTGCVTRRQIEAAIWINNFYPDEGESISELCINDPRLERYVFYRKLNNGKFEVISICDPNAGTMFSMTASDVKEMLDGTLPE